MRSGRGCRNVFRSIAPPGRWVHTLVVGAWVFALLLSGCGGSDRSGTKASSGSATITPSSGGAVKLSGFVLDIPRGAMSTEARVSVGQSTKPVDLPLAASVGPAFDVDLGGATLRTPATVTVSIDRSALPAGTALADVVLARYDTSAATWEPLPSKADNKAGTVTATVDHFSGVQPFAPKAAAVAGAALDLYTKGLQFIGVRTAPPECAKPAPSGVSLTLAPKANVASTIPGGNFVHLVLGCPNSVSGDKVTIKVANNRSFAQVLAPQSGLQVSSIDHVDNGSVSETLSAALRDLFKTSGVFLPGNAEATITVTVKPGTTGSFDVRTSQLALAMDGASRLIDAVVDEPKQAEALNCAYSLMASSATPPLHDVAKIAMDCANPVAKGLAKILLGPVRLFFENQMQQQVTQIDNATKAILGGGEGIDIAVAAPVVHGGSGLVTLGGVVGTLQLGRSTQSDVTAAAGAPDNSGQQTGYFTRVPATVLGYDCTGTSCHTLYYVNSTTGLLVGFYTESSHFQTQRGTTPGMSVAEAQQREGQQAQIGCHTGMFFTDPTAVAAVRIEVDLRQSQKVVSISSEISGQGRFGIWDC